MKFKSIPTKEMINYIKRKLAIEGHFFPIAHLTEDSCLEPT